MIEILSLTDSNYIPFSGILYSWHFHLILMHLSNPNSYTSFHYTVLVSTNIPNSPLTETLILTTIETLIRTLIWVHTLKQIGLHSKFVSMKVSEIQWKFTESQSIWHHRMFLAMKFREFPLNLWDFRRFKFSVCKPFRVHQIFIGFS